MPTAVAHFASLRGELIVIESPSVPIWDGGRQVGTKPGKSHVFRDHHCTVEGQKSIDYMRERMKAGNGPEIWEMDGSSDVPSAISLLSEMAVAPIDRVREILADEDAGPARPEVIGTARAILERAGVADQGPGAQRAKPRHEVVS
jgi:hypothetical protein